MNGPPLRWAVIFRHTNFLRGKTMEPLLDISIFKPKKAKARPKVDRAANAIAMRKTRDEIAATRFVYDDEPDMLPCHANDNVATIAHKAAPAKRSIKSFHRLWNQKSFHRTNDAMNNELKAVGERYRRSFFAAGGTDSSPPPAYVAPEQEYDPRRYVSIAPEDKALPYHDAAKVLDALGLLEVFEEIAVHERNTAPAGMKHSGYATEKQGQAAAVEAVRCGLRALKDHYDAAIPRSGYSAVRAA
jgi:hypothetical protein